MRQINLLRDTLLPERGKTGLVLTAVNILLGVILLVELFLLPAWLYSRKAGELAVLQAQDSHAQKALAEGLRMEEQLREAEKKVKILAELKKKNIVEPELLKAVEKAVPPETNLVSVNIGEDPQHGKMMHLSAVCRREPNEKAASLVENLRRSPFFAAVDLAGISTGKAAGGEETHRLEIEALIR
ncbi:MAG: PilN domain-containing protein [Armatimonadetes bacterium]|nr:PilN domain-containing protein [Armatimonadota bacterium]